MAYLRFSRDRRGYEQFALIQQTNNRRGGNKPRPRLLYWFRTPPNVKVGREPFDPEVRRLLETRNPGILFDWEAIESTPIPPVEVENWRERRRAERAARQSAEDPEPSESAAPDADAGQPAGQATAVDAVVDVPPEMAAGDGAVAAADAAATDAGEPPVPISAGVSQQPQTPGSGRRRRRRRRRRGGNQPIREVGPVAENPGVPDGEPEPGSSDGEV